MGQQPKPRTLTQAEIDQIARDAGAVVDTRPLGQGLTPEQIEKLLTEPAAPGGSQTAGAGSRFMSDAWREFNPMNILRGVKNVAGDAYEGVKRAAAYGFSPALMAADPEILLSTPVIGQELRRIIDQVPSIREAHASGDRTRIANAWAEAVPVVGPIAKTMSEKFKAGDVAGGLGTGVGAAGAAFLPGATAKTVGRTATAAGRTGARLQLTPAITREAEAMTGQTGAAARQAIIDTAVKERLFPQVWNPRVNPATAALDASEAAVREGLKNPAAPRVNPRTGRPKPAAPLANLPFDTRPLIGNRFVRDTFAAANKLEPNDRMLAGHAARPSIVQITRDIPRTLGDQLDMTAGSRPLHVGAEPRGATVMGQRMARSVGQAKRDVAASMLETDGTAAARAAAAELRRQMGLAPLEQTFENMRPIVTHEGVPGMDFRAQIGVINRFAGAGIKGALKAGDIASSAARATGANVGNRVGVSAAMDRLIRRALIAELSQIGAR